MKNTKAYDSGYDYYTSGGRNLTDSPYSEGSILFTDWEEGYDDAQRAEREDYTDIIEQNS
jgi:hypothetical protein